MKLLLTASFVAVSLASGAALAQATGVGPYVGASVGMANYSTDQCPGDCDKTDVGGKIFGGYMFTPYIGGEVAYASYGKAKLNADVAPGVNVLGELKSSGWSAFLVGQYPIDNFRLFGKLGFARLDNEVSVTVPNFGSASDSDSSTEFAWGLGVTYMFNKNLGIRGEYESLRYKWEGEKDTLGFWSVGLQYNF
jgi:OmpA-OmpF porin, OOP family